MEPIQDFSSLVSRLRAMKERKRVVVVCPNDPHTEYVIIRSLREGFADFLLVADTPHLLNAEYIRNQYPDHVKVYEASSGRSAPGARRSCRCTDERYHQYRQSASCRIE